MPSLINPLAPLLGPGRRALWWRRRARRLLAAALAACAVIGLESALRPTPPEPRVPLVVAARALPAGHVLAADDLTTTPVPASVAADAATARTDPARLVGRLLAGAVERAEPLRESRLVGTAALHAADAGGAVIAVPLSSVLVARTARVGSHVDLAVDGRVLASDVPVLATSGAPPTGGDALGSAGGSGTAELLVAVSRAEALRLAGAIGDPQSPRPPVVLLRP